MGGSERKRFFNPPTLSERSRVLESSCLPPTGGTARRVGLRGTGSRHWDRECPAWDRESQPWDRESQPGDQESRPWDRESQSWDRESRPWAWEFRPFPPVGLGILAFPPPGPGNSAPPGIIICASHVHHMCSTCASQVHHRCITGASQVHHRCITGASQVITGAHGCLQVLTGAHRCSQVPHNHKSC